MKIRYFIAVLFSCLLPYSFLMAQENKTISLLNLNLAVDQKCIGKGCGGALEEQAQTFSILKASLLPSGQIDTNSFYLEKHEWQEDDKGNKVEVKLSEHYGEINKTETGTEYIIHYPTAKMTLAIHYTLGEFNPETKTQDLTISNIEGVLSFKQGGGPTPQKISFQWKLLYKDDGSIKIVDANNPNFEIDRVVFKIGAGWGWTGPYGGGTSFEVQGTTESTAEDGQKTKVPHVESTPISYRASSESEDALACGQKQDPFSTSDPKILDFVKNFGFLL